MRTAIASVAGCLCVLAASGISFPGAASSVQAEPLPAAVYRVAALGHGAAAADLVWLRTIQLIGSERYGNARYPALERWVKVIGELDPSFQTPPAVAGVLLVTEGDRADEFLRVAEANAGASYYFAMLRGFVAYFGKQDVDAAAGHYERAAARGGPEYLKAFAARLRTHSLQCSDIQSDLVEVSVADRFDQDALRRNAREIVINCFKGEIKRAAVAYRLLGRGPAPSLDALVAEKQLNRIPPAPPGECWTLIGDSASLGPCGATR